jgi:predicted RNA-binding protein with EMAP domain
VIYATKEVSTEANTSKTKYAYMLRSCLQNTEQNYNTEIAKRCFENVASSGIWERQQRIMVHEDIKRMLNSGNACYYAVQNLVSSRLMFENTEIEILKTITLLVILYGHEAWLVTLKE